MRVSINGVGTNGILDTAIEVEILAISLQVPAPTPLGMQGNAFSGILRITIRSLDELGRVLAGR
jgi:hypothetical protein